MLQAATIAPGVDRSESLTQLEAEVRALVSGAKSHNTLRAYESDWADFKAWCDEHGFNALPADSKPVGLYLTALASLREMKTSTIKRRLYSIGHFHRLNGFDAPGESASVKAVVAGIRRRNGAKQIGREPLLKDSLKAMVESLPEGLAGIRDKAILLLGFFSACRRSELVQLQVEDLEFTGDGLVLTLERSKTDQDQEGREVGLPFAANETLCPVRSINRWIEQSEIKEGPIFRSIDRHGNVNKEGMTGAAIALIVKRAASAAGIDATNISAHSLRSGFCTEAALNGVEERIIMRQTGHKCERVVRGYIKEAVFQNNGAKALSF